MWSYTENQLIPCDPSTIVFSPTGDFYSDIATYCELANIKIHPFLRDASLEDNPLTQAALMPETLEKLEEKPEEAKLPTSKEPVRTLSIYSKKIDKNSLYALKAVLPTSQIHTLRLSNNGFTYENCEILVQAILESNISRLFFDWNPIPNPKKKPMTSSEPDSLFAKLIENPKLEYLYLRANEIDDEAMPAICEKLAANNTLKCIDFSMNRLKTEGMKMLASTIRKNSSLELLGIGSMGLTLEDLRPILHEFGKIRLTEQEAKTLKDRIKERDAIIEKNKKARGKKEEPVPKVNSLEYDEKGNGYEIRKEKFRHLNIGLNKLDDTALEELEQLLARTHASFVVTIASKYMGKETYKTLSSKYESRVIY